jgi:LPS-assembly protein
LFLALFYTPFAFAQQDFYDIEADELIYDQAENVYTGIGGVIIKQRDRVLKADWIRLNRKEMKAWGKGNVVFVSKGDELKGEEVFLDLATHTGEVRNGKLFLKENNFHVTGERIIKTGEDSYRVEKGTFTTCDGEKAPWKFTAQEMDVTLEGYGRVKNASFLVRDLPVLYSPYLIFPAKTKRQTGLLLPELGYSERDGATLNLPFFWAISPGMDATFYPYYMVNRGLMTGLEFRYLADYRSKGTVRFDYLKDNLARQEYQKGNNAAPYNERYWFRAKGNQGLPSKVDVKWDLDWVSDRDYLREFRNGLSGFSASHNDFLSTYGRGLDDETVMTRKSSLILTRYWDRFDLTGGFNYNRNLLAANDDETMQQLPTLQFNAAKQPVYGNLLYGQMGGTYNHYWRTVGDRGQVLDLSPTLYFPWKWKRFLSLETSVNLQETLYAADQKQSAMMDSSAHRTLSNWQADLSTDVFKVFNLDSEKIQRIRHLIRPQVVYQYTPEVDQSKLPSFIGAVAKKNMVTYGLLNNFTAKIRQDPSPPQPPQPGLSKKDDQGDLWTDYYGFKARVEEEENKEKFAYFDFMRFKVSQSYDFTNQNRPFTDLLGELEFLLTRYLSLRSDASYSPYDSQWVSFNNSLALSDHRGDSAQIEYRYNVNGINELNTYLNVKVTDRIKGTFLNRYSIDQKKNYETIYGLLYHHQCWQVQFNYSQRPDDRALWFNLSLTGIGGI